MMKVNRLMTKLCVRVTGAWRNFRHEERGDTNFISMLIIIAIVVVLAGLFLAFGKTVMKTVSDIVTTWILNLGL